MTYAEVRDEVDAFNRRRKMKIKEQQQIQALADYQLAQLIGVAYNDPKKFPKNIKKAYPHLFDSSEDWRESKDQFRRYAEEFNARRQAQRGGEASK
jgi:hypothetical protein